MIFKPQPLHAVRLQRMIFLSCAVILMSHAYVFCSRTRQQLNVLWHNLEEIPTTDELITLCFGENCKFVQGRREHDTIKNFNQKSLTSGQQHGHSCRDRRGLFAACAVYYAQLRDGGFEWVWAVDPLADLFFLIGWLTHQNGWLTDLNG